MIEIIQESSDRILIKLDPGGPVSLDDLTESFGALARYYERHYRSDGESAPRLYVTKLETGSVWAEIVPYGLILGGLAITAMDSATIVAEFTRRLSAGIRAFSDPASSSAKSPPSRDDAEDIAAFVKPLAGKKGASLGITHARMEKTDGDRKTVVEYKFDEAEINRAAINIDNALEHGTPLIDSADGDKSSRNVEEVMLFFDQASRKPGKEKGRTGDRGIIPDVTDKPLPVYFRKSFQNLKDQMIKGDVNPLTCAFVVDAHVQILDDEPKGYIITNVHQVIENGDDDE